MTIRDDGVGFDPAAAASGLGIRLMQARAAEAGGNLEITSRPGQGTLLKVRLPLPAGKR